MFLFFSLPDLCRWSQTCQKEGKNSLQYVPQLNRVGFCSWLSTVEKDAVFQRCAGKRNRSFIPFKSSDLWFPQKIGKKMRLLIIPFSWENIIKVPSVSACHSHSFNLETEEGKELKFVSQSSSVFLRGYVTTRELRRVEGKKNLKDLSASNLRQFKTETRYHQVMQIATCE